MTVTVVIPTLPHRHEQLRRALRSVAEQTYRDFRVMILPNGPDHGLRSVVAESGLSPPDVQIVPLGRPWNFGWGAVNRVVAGFLCTTTHQAYLDDDNYYLSSHLELCMAAIGDRDMAYSQIIRGAERGIISGSAWHEGTSDRRFLDASNIVIRTDALAKAAPDPYFGNGWEADFAERLFRQGGTFAFVPEATVFYTGFNQGA
jgi:GT2 family glycosyltransferase